MRLPEEAIIEFKEIYEQERGEELSMDEAREEAKNLMRLCIILYSK